MDYETLGEILGDDVMGESTVGASRLSASRAGALQKLVRSLPSPPNWRGRLAPGVPMPGEGLEILPLTPSTAAGVFAAATTQITFTARPQAPFRAERLISTVRRTGAAGTIILATSLFVGRALQMVELGSFDVEVFGPTAFGVRLSLVQCEPGVLISIPCQATPAPAGADTVAVSLMFLGHTVR